MPVAALWPANTLARTRVHVYIHAARWIAVVAVASWLQGLAAAIPLGLVMLAADYWLLNGRLTFFRKMAGRQIVLPMPGEPVLTHTEAIFLRTSQKGVQGQAWAIAFNTLALAALTLWLPWTLAPSLIVWIAHFAARWLPIEDERASALYRRVKWSGMLLASILPFLWHATAPWAPAFFWAMLFLLIDSKRIALRRKLPVSEWPRDLYF